MADEKNLKKEKSTTGVLRHGWGALSILQKTWIGLVLVLVLFAGAVLLLILLKSALLEKNDQFILRKIIISPPDGEYNATYWTSEKNREKRCREIADAFSLREGETNLFADRADPAKLKKQFEEAHPEIEKVKVRRILPDRLEFQIFERCPVADIGAVKGKTGQPVLRMNTRYLDRDGVVLDSANCQQLTLPRIIDMSDGEITRLQPGKIVSGRVLDALAFINHLNASSDPKCSQITIRDLAVVEMDNAIICDLTYRNSGKSFTVLLPVSLDSERIRDVIERLLPALDRQYRNGDFTKKIDLRFENRSIIR